MKWSKRIAHWRDYWKASRISLAHVHSFLVFVGNPRSGTTLMRSLIDAHPNAVVSNEEHFLEHMLNNESWRSVITKLLLNAQRFNQHSKHTGYNYRVPFDSFGMRDHLYVIGDKKSSRSARLLAKQPLLFEQLTTWSPVPLRFLHCVRPLLLLFLALCLFISGGRLPSFESLELLNSHSFGFV